MFTNLGIGMLAFPREDVGIQEAVKNLRNGGFHGELNCFAEPGDYGEGIQNVAWHQCTEPLGAHANYLRALRFFLEETEFKHFLLVEDDVLFCKNTSLFLENAIERYPYYHLFSLYLAAKVLRHHSLAQGWGYYNEGRNTWGTLAICFRRTPELTEYLDLQEKLGLDPFKTHYDAELFSFMLEKEAACYVHNPSLVEHLGAISVIGHPPLPKDLEQRDGNASAGAGFNYLLKHPLESGND